MGTYKYKAFISYSHKDDRWGRWLHRRLETYPLPKNIVGNVTKTGEIPKRLKPIFRDREELAAADNLGDKIEDALSNSENLIMICSPAAARSHWVNQEVLYFKRHNRGAQIFSVIVEGEPFASNMPGREAEECFPPALRYQLDEEGNLSDTPAEPLAADLRDHADGKRLGLLKLVSGMIGVGLDEVVQRDMKRSRRRVTAITSGALATVLAMGTLTGFALEARQEAEQRTANAEKLIEFMVTDLKEELEKVGRLDALRAVGQEASDYYDDFPLHKHDDEALARRSRVYHGLGEVAFKDGFPDLAHKYWVSAYKSSGRLAALNPNDPEKLYVHGFSTYWLGYYFYKLQQWPDCGIYFDEYVEITSRMVEINPTELRYRHEWVSARTNKGVATHAQHNFEEAIQIFRSSLNAIEALLPRFQDEQLRRDHIDTLAHLSRAYLHNGDISNARNIRESVIAVIKDRISKSPERDIRDENMLGSALWALGQIEIVANNFDTALMHLQLSEATFETLLAVEPENTAYIGEKTVALAFQAFVHKQQMEQEKFERAQAKFMEGLRILVPDKRVTLEDYWEKYLLTTGEKQ